MDAAIYNKTYSSPETFITVNGRIIQSITITVAREKAPIYTMGNEAKKHIAGSIIPLEPFGKWPDRFDINLLGYNEYEHLMQLRLLNCELLSIVTVNDPPSITFLTKEMGAWHAAEVVEKRTRPVDWPPWGGDGLLSK